MNCEEIKKHALDYIEGTLPPEQQQAITQYLNNNDCDCKEELEQMQKLWQAMPAMETPAPSPMMDHRFQGMLEGYKQAVAERPAEGWIQLANRVVAWWKRLYAAPLPYSAAILLIGLLAGWALNRGGASAPNEGQQLVALTQEVQDLRSMMMLTMIEQPEAQERIKAVSMVQALPQANDKVIEALMTTLNEDPNENVRLVAAEALAGLAYDPRVRQGLIASIAKQQSPLLQVSLAEIMVALQEKESIAPMQKLINDSTVMTMVKDKLTQSIEAINI